MWRAGISTRMGKRVHSQRSEGARYARDRDRYRDIEIYRARERASERARERERETDRG